MIEWIQAHHEIILIISAGVLSEIIAVRQALKYPDNDGFGGILAAVLKMIHAFQKKPQQLK